MTATPAPSRTLSAVWYGVGDLRLEERPVPALGPTGVLVEVRACGVCATDLHLLDGTIRFYDPPRVLGHEVGGVVRAIGASVRHVRPGDAVALDTSVPCGTCFHCREGAPFFCPDRTSVFAGFSERAVVPASVVFPLPPGVDAATGALAEPLSCALHAVERAALHPGDTVAILGAGAIGLLVLAVARLAGATRLIVSDPEPLRRTIAERLGATHTVDPVAQSPVDVVAQLTGGRGADCVFEAAGVQATVDEAVRLPRRGGTLVQVSVPGTGVTFALPAYDLFARELTIKGSFVRTTEFRRAVELLGVLDLVPLITERFPLGDVRAAFEAARGRRGVRVLVGPAAGS
ncbi:MAG: zinc-binding dehydrogenase [Candidatus Rokubacteria bacterium]|nr:zinc-binding dehydrogenase [Candidatus Rokubacteria bacterium]